VFALDQQDLRPPDIRPVVLEFFAQRMTAVFDVLRPAIGIADTYAGVGFDRKTDPFAKRHWMTFADPTKSDLADQLEKEGVGKLERRPWGGVVERRWEDPFNPTGVER
jgi:hypothetical protein